MRQEASESSWKIQSIHGIQMPMQTNAFHEDVERSRREIKNALKGPVVIIGMMGAGKSKIGRILAESLQVDFADADDEIEKTAGCRIRDIFELYGEPAFRDLEKKVILRLIGQGQGVIATGGGAVMTPEIAQAVFAGDVTVIWIRADTDILIERAARDPDRPMLKGSDPEKKMRELIEIRTPVYAKADIIIDTHEGPAAETAEKAMEGLYRHVCAD